MPAAGACRFYNEKRRLADRAFFLYGKIPYGVVALRVLAAGIKKFSFTGTFFNQSSFSAFRAGDIGGERRGVVAVWIFGAAQEPAPRAGLLEENIAAALRAYADFPVFFLRTFLGDDLSFFIP